MPVTGEWISRPTNCGRFCSYVLKSDMPHRMAIVASADFHDSRKPVTQRLTKSA